MKIIKENLKKPGCVTNDVIVRLHHMISDISIRSIVFRKMADPNQQGDNLSPNIEQDTNENAPLLQNQERNEPPPPFNSGYNIQGRKIWCQKRRKLSNSFVDFELEVVFFS